METEFNRDAEITSRDHWNRQNDRIETAAPDEERLVDPN